MGSRGWTAGIPVGARVPGIIALVLVGVLAGTMLLSAIDVTGSGGMENHGPSGPLPSDGAGGQTPPSDVPTEHMPPEGGHG